MYKHRFYALYATPALAGGTVSLPPTYNKPIFLPFPAAQIRLSSSSASDNNKAFTLIGYGASGIIVKESILLNAIDGQTPVTSVNSYCALEQFSSSVQVNCVGNIYVYDSGATVVLGVPDRCMAQIPIGTNINNAEIGWMCIPPTTAINISKISFTLANNTISTHRMIMRGVSSSVGNIASSTNALIRSWGITSGFNSFDYNPGEFVVENPSANHIFVWFELLSIIGDENGKVTVHIHYQNI